MKEEVTLTEYPRNLALEEGESVVLLTRQHWFVFRDPLILSFFLPFVLFAAVFFLDRTSWPVWLIRFLIQTSLYLASFSFSMGVIMFFWRLFLWFRTFYVVTNKRLMLINQRGLFRKERRETSLDMIQDVKAEVNGLQAALYGFGNVIIQISSQEAQLVFEKVGRPYDAQQMIMKEARIGKKSEE